MDEIIATFKLCSHRTLVFHELLLKWNDVGYFPSSDRKNKQLNGHNISILRKNFLCWTEILNFDVIKFISFSHYGVYFWSHVLSYPSLWFFWLWILSGKEHKEIRGKWKNCRYKREDKITSISIPNSFLHRWSCCLQIGNKWFLPFLSVSLLFLFLAPIVLGRLSSVMERWWGWKALPCSQS